MFDIRVMRRIEEHAEAAQEIFKTSDRIVYIALQGSQNYNLAYEKSDVDSKCIVIPTLDEIVNNKKPISSTHLMENDEHLDLKDIRLMFDCFKKQNINFIEILFSEYNLRNKLYAEDWDKMIDHKEDIAHYNPYAAVKCIKGMALEKYHALKHEYPSKKEILTKFGYDPKQLSHIIRLYDFILKYINDYPYSECLKYDNVDHMIDIKKGKYKLKKAETIAEKTTNKIVKIADDFCEAHKNSPNKNVEQLMYEIKFNIITKSIKNEVLSLK